jgi:hypothetical protein
MLTVSDMAAVSSIMALAHWSPGGVKSVRINDDSFSKKSPHIHFTLVQNSFANLLI